MTYRTVFGRSATRRRITVTSSILLTLITLASTSAFGQTVAEATPAEPGAEDNDPEAADTEPTEAASAMTGLANPEPRIASGKNMTLQIDYDVANSRPAPPKGSETSKKREENIKTACARLAEPMKMGNGPWGYGAFTNSSCAIGGRPIDGKVITPAWILRIADQPKELTLTVLVNRGDSEPLVVSKLTLPGSDNGLAFFADAEFASLVAYALLDAMPYGLSVQPPKNGKLAPIRGKQPSRGKNKVYKYKQPEPPKELEVFTLAFNPETASWTRKPLATVKLAKVLTPAQAKSTQSVALWALPASLIKKFPSDAVWAHVPGKPGQRQEELSAAVREAHKKLVAADADKQLMPFILEGGGQKVTPPTTVAVLTGMQLIPASEGITELVDGALMLSLYFELPVWVLDHVRYSLDMFLEKTSSVTLVDGSQATLRLGYMRHTVGAAYGIDIGMAGVRLQARPQLSLWSLTSVLPVLHPTSGAVFSAEPFSSGAIAIGFDAIALAQFSPFTARLTVGTDLALGLTAEGSAGTQRGSLIGGYQLDEMFGSGDKKYNGEILAIIQFEKMVFTKPATSTRQLAIEEVNLSTGFVGGGFGLYW